VKRSCRRASIEDAQRDPRPGWAEVGVGHPSPNVARFHYRERHLGPSRPLEDSGRREVLPYFHKSGYAPRSCGARARDSCCMSTHSCDRDALILIMASMSGLPATFPTRWSAMRDPSVPQSRPTRGTRPAKQQRHPQVLYYVRPPEIRFPYHRPICYRDSRAPAWSLALTYLSHLQLATTTKPYRPHSHRSHLTLVFSSKALHYSSFPLLRYLFVQL